MLKIFFSLLNIDYFYDFNELYLFPHEIVILTFHLLNYQFANLLRPKNILKPGIADWVVTDHFAIQYNTESAKWTWRLLSSFIILDVNKLCL